MWTTRQPTPARRQGGTGYGGSGKTGKGPCTDSPESARTGSRRALRVRTVSSGLEWLKAVSDAPSGSAAIWLGKAQTPAHLFALRSGGGIPFSG